MSILNWFAKQKKKSPQSEKLNIPGNLWIKCKSCNDVIFSKDLINNHHVCPHCNHHFRLTPEERLKETVDPNSFQEIGEHIEAIDVLKFKDTAPYAERLKKAKSKTKHKDAIITGTATIKHHPVCIGIMNFGFLKRLGMKKRK